MNAGNWSRLAGMHGGLALTEEERSAAYERISSQAGASFDYACFLVLSAVVATLGLVTNSSPVIIGAMVLAPLMNPVLGVSMGVVRGDLRQVVDSLRTLALGLLVGFAVAALAAWILPGVEITPEIRNRVRPTLYDLFIGMAAGAGGALAQVRLSVAGVLPGVAIAVSLMPPLAVTGIGFARVFSAGFESHWPLFYGSMLLWLSNLAAINLAAIAVFLLFGFGERPEGRPRREFLRDLGVSVALVLLVTVPLLHFLRETVRQTREDRVIRSVLTEEFAALDPAAELVDLDWGPHLEKQGWTRIKATLFTPSMPTREQVFRWRAYLENLLNRPLELEVVVNPVYQFRESPEGGVIYERPTRPEPP